MSRIPLRLTTAVLLATIVPGCRPVAAQSKVKILLIGQVTSEHCPAPEWFDHEPLVDYSLVATKLYYTMTFAEAQRFVRI